MPISNIKNESDEMQMHETLRGSCLRADWPLLKLKDVGVSLIDCDHKTPKAQEVGFPYIGIPQIKDGRISLEGARLISEEDFHQWRRKSKPIPNDIILSRRCNPGETAFVPENLEIALGQNLVLLRSDANLLYPPFLRWVVQGPQWWDQVGKFINVGAIFNSLKCADIPQFEIRVPPPKVQEKIADILGSLDKKIELNRQANQTLEQIAQALFKSWFVDFEPTRAKIAAKKAGASPEEVERAAMCAISGKTPDQLAQLPPETQQNLKTTAALFPDVLVDSELGKVPEGWEVLPLVGISEIIMGQSPNGDSYNENGEGELLINGPVEFGEYHPKKIKWTTSPTKFSSDKDLIVCVRGSTTGRYVKSDGKYCLGRGVCAIRSKHNQQAFVDQLFKHCLEKLLTQATGSTFPSWNGPVLKSYKVNAATTELRTKYSSFVQEFESQISLNAASIQDLSNLRDSLLPKLLSGELHLGLETT